MPSPPRDVRVFCPVVLWRPPAKSNGQLQGYEIQLTGAFSGSLSFTEEFSQSYHIISDPEDVLKGPISIRVSLSICHATCHVTIYIGES